MKFWNLRLSPIFICFTLLLGATPLARGEVIYNNTSNRVGFSYSSPLEFGDEIILAGASRTITNFVFEYFGTNFSGDEQMRVRFYRTDGPVNPQGAPIPQTVLYDSGLFPISNSTTQSTITLPRLKVEVPDSFVWAVLFSGVTSNETSGLEVYTPLTVGNNFSDFWENRPQGWELRTLLGGGTVNFGALIEATASVNDNTAPFLSGLGNLTTPKNQTAGPVVFTIGDLESAASNLVVTVSTSNPLLAPVGNISISGTGADRTLRITPAANMEGIATVTVSVRDPSGAAENRTFILRVGPPTITAIIDLQTAEDVPTAQIPFIVGDQETAANNLLVSATSANPGLIPPAGILLSGSGSNRTVRFIPGTNQFGSSVITLTVTDEIGAAGSTTFTLRVTPVNDPPEVSDIKDQTQAGVRVPFVVHDAETAADTLDVTATSSNQALVANENIVFGGSGSNRTVTINPKAGQSGSITIQIRVTDAEGSSAVDSFVFTFTANTFPTISDILDQTVESGKSTVPIPFVVRDLETPAGNLVLNANSSDTVLIPVANIVFGGSGSNRTVVVTPATNQFGATHITVVATDANGGVASDSFQITVISTAEGPPQISVHPQSQTRMEGEGVVFNVAAHGLGPITYQWRFNGNDLAGAINDALTVNNLIPPQAGAYSVRVSNRFGSTTSSNAVLTLIPAVRLTSLGFGANGLFRLNLAGPPNAKVRIEVSPNLQSWVPLGTNTVGAQVTDPGSATTGSRFYRGVLLP